MDGILDFEYKIGSYLHREVDCCEEIFMKQEAIENAEVNILIAESINKTAKEVQLFSNDYKLFVEQSKIKIIWIKVCFKSHISHIHL